MKILVTGANGFLGSWLTRTLVDQGYEVYALVRKGSDLTELNGVSCKYLYGDVTDLNSLEKAFEGIDYVFHLAGLVAYKKSDRKKMEAVNVQGTANVISACLDKSIKRLLYVSSVTAIGASFNKNSVLNEDSPYTISALNLGYFETKHEAEEYVKRSCKEQGLDCVIVNPSTIYGPGDAKKGSRKMQVKVAQGKFRFYTSGGVSIVAVEDVVSAIINAWKVGKSGERYILSGDNISVEKLFALIAKAAGQPPPDIKIPNFILFAIGLFGDLVEKFGLKSAINTENARTATMYHWFDNSKAKRDLKFNPRPADQAIKSSVTWMKENGLLNP